MRGSVLEDCKVGRSSCDKRLALNGEIMSRGECSNAFNYRNAFPRQRVMTLPASLRVFYQIQAGSKQDLSGSVEKF